MAKVNKLFQDQQEHEFEKAYAEHLKNNIPADHMSETDFADYWENRQQRKSHFGFCSN